MEELPNHVKVRFLLPQDEDDWPPVETESLWAEQLEDGTCRLDNAPWFVNGAAIGDIFRVRVDAEGVRWAEAKLFGSGNCTIRVIPSSAGLHPSTQQSIVDTFASLGVWAEGFGQMAIVALSIPVDADLARIKGVLTQGERDGDWGFDEGCITEAWVAADTP